MNPEVIHVQSDGRRREVWRFVWIDFRTMKQSIVLSGKASKVFSPANMQAIGTWLKYRRAR